MDCSGLRIQVSFKLLACFGRSVKDGGEGGDVLEEGGAERTRAKEEAD